MAINLFLDANILLSFYALSNADIDQLKQLKGVVSKGDIKLFVSDQLEDEVERNRETKIRESFKALRDDTFKCQAPSFVKLMVEFIDLQNILKSANKKHSELVSAVSELVKKRELEADKIILELIEVAGVTKTDSVKFNAAFNRFLRGNPPGKKKSTIGDEINWEFLLKEVPNNEDLHLVSADGDYVSPNYPDMANEFLSKEWRIKKKSELHYYKDLNDFFKQHVPKIKLVNQAKLSALISELAASGSFADTHGIIAKFPEDPEFNDAQIVELMNINENNSQVGWIDTDPDVASFYAPIKDRYSKIKVPELDEEVPF